MSVRIDRHRLSALVECQHGVVSRRQLLEIGLTRSIVETGLATGRFVSIHPGVYAVGHRQLRRQGHWLAAVLAVGPAAALSHRDAAALHGLLPNVRSRVDVTTTRRARGSPGIDVHHTAVLAPQDVVIVDAITVTTADRTLVDLAYVVSRDRLAKALREAEHLRIVDLGRIEDALRRTRSRNGRGHATLRAVLAEHRRRGTQLTRSILEDRFLTLCERHGLPRPSTNFHIGAHEVDACWPDRRLAVELDGWERHKDRHAFQRDREKGNAITRAGYRLLRFTHDDVVRRPAHTAATLHAFLADA